MSKHYEIPLLEQIKGYVKTEEQTNWKLKYDSLMLWCTFYELTNFISKLYLISIINENKKISQSTFRESFLFQK